MRICVKVAEIESFAETARHMNMSAPAVTRAVAALEDLIGVRLFVRTTRSVKMTEAGTRYFSDCRRILADIAEAEATAGGTYATPTGTLAITASALFGQMYVLPIVIGYLDAYPSVQALTLFVDRPITSKSMAFPPTPPICGTNAWASTEWRFAEDQKVTIGPTLQCNTNEAAITAARHGFGLTRVLHYQIGPALVAGELQILLGDHEGPPLPIHLLYPEGKSAPTKVRAFIDMAVPILRDDRLLN